MSEWRPVIGFPSYSMRLDGTVRGRLGTVLKPQLSGSGYLYVGFVMAGRRTNQFIHRLLLRTFGQPPRGADQRWVNHIDGNKTNNALSNLEWVTPHENALHSTHVLGNLAPVMRGVDNMYRRAVLRINRTTGETRRYETIAEAATEGCTASGICDCCNGRQRTHRGYQWQYASVPTAINHKVGSEPRTGPVERHTRSVAALDGAGQVLRVYNKVSDVAADGFSIASVVTACRGRSKKHRGLVWRYWDGKQSRYEVVR